MVKAVWDNFDMYSCDEFFNAITRGDTGLIDTIINFPKTRMNITKLDHLRRNAIHYFILYNGRRTEMVTLATSFLKANKYDLNLLQQQDGEGLTPLHYASMDPFLPMLVELLISYKIDVTITDNYGRTALHYAAMYGSFKSLAYLLDSDNQQLVNIIDKDMNSVLHLICFHYKPGLVAEMCIDSVIRNMERDIITSKNRTGKTALHLFCISNKYYGSSTICIFRTLIKYININAEDNDKRTALYYAVALFNADLMEMLIESGAHLNIEYEWVQRLFKSDTIDPYIVKFCTYHVYSQMKKLGLDTNTLDIQNNMARKCYNYLKIISDDYDIIMPYEGYLKFCETIID